MHLTFHKQTPKPAQANLLMSHQKHIMSPHNHLRFHMDIFIADGQHSEANSPPEHASIHSFIKLHSNLSR